MGIDFAHFSLESGMVFECMNLFMVFLFQMNKKEREICEFEVNFKKSFLLAFQSK